MSRILLLVAAAASVASGCSSGTLSNGDGGGKGGAAGSAAGGRGGSSAATDGGADSADARDAYSCGPWLSPTPPPAGTTIPCPIDPTCRATYAEVEAAQADGGTCDNTNATSVALGACSSKLVWRAQSWLWFRACIYETDGALIGSQYCTDTACSYAGYVLGDNWCADAGVTTTVCAPRGG